VATPTMEDRRKLAGSGVAMPDGSYYIRNAGELDDAIAAVGRATPNAGESDVARRNSVRRHIMKRARALKLESKIPDSWNPDGSLKHSAAVEEFLAHFGVKGMRWGVRRSKKDLENQAATHETIAKAHVLAAAHVQKEHADLRKNGLQSVAFKRVFGKTAPSKSEWYFFRQHGVSRAEALQETDNNLRRLHNQYVRSANRHAGKAATLRAHAAKMQHDELLGEVLVHFGVLGMKWGVRRRRSASSSPAPMSSEAAKAARFQTRAQTHGTRSLTNAELQALVTRMNLENQYGRLNPQQVSTGRKVTHDLLKTTGGVAGNVAKTTVTAFAVKYAAQGVEHLIKAAAKGKG